MAYSKAKIKVEGKQTKTIEVLFNPSEYTVQNKNKYSWQAIPGLQSPIAQFVHGETPTLTMDLFFDTSESGEDVRERTQEIVQIMDVDSDLHAPPICTFYWGSLQFKGILEQVSQRFTMFTPEGIPVRARLQVTFRSWQSAKEQYVSIPRQSADRTKQWTVKQGDQLYLIAYEEYENPAYWRKIAEANDIDNPLELEVGRSLIVPRLE